MDLLSETKQLCEHASKTSISDLFKNGLISLIDAPIRYNLTERGINISKKICEVVDIDIRLTSLRELSNKIHTYVQSSVSQKLKLTRVLNDFNSENTNIQISNECSNKKQNKGSNKSKLYKSKSADCIIIEGHKECIDKDFVKQKTRKNNLPVRKAQEKPKEANNLSNNKTDSSNNLPENIYLESNKFEIILLVDTQETCGGKMKPQHDATIMELTQLDVLFEIRHLKVGDFAWIARCKSTNNELILPYIVERKRIDDLSASITDGRFHEQKFRLKQSGIRNLMYIIEEHEKGKRLTIPHSSLMQASINTLIQDGFSVKYTKSHKDSMFYLSSLTRILIKLFKEKDLIGCKKDSITQIDISNNTCNLMQFDEFNKAASKQKVFKVSEMFVRHLLQLKGMSVEKASAIVERYPTPRVLIEGFQNSDGNGELLLANINFGDKKRLIGPTISKTIYQLYTKKNLS
ncbi:unnamed protein product [Xylocopa violacea]